MVHAYDLTLSRLAIASIWCLLKHIDARGRYDEVANHFAELQEQLSVKQVTKCFDRALLLLDFCKEHDRSCEIRFLLLNLL